MLSEPVTFVEAYINRYMDLSLKKDLALGPIKSLMSPLFVPFNATHTVKMAEAGLKPLPSDLAIFYFYETSRFRDFSQTVLNATKNLTYVKLERESLLKSKWQDVFKLQDLVLADTDPAAFPGHRQGPFHKDGQTSPTPRKGLSRNVANKMKKLHRTSENRKQFINDLRALSITLE